MYYFENVENTNNVLLKTKTLIIVIAEEIKMDIKEKVEAIIEEIKNNPNIKEEFEKEPVKVIEKLIGVDLPDDAVEKIIAGVKAKLTVDNVSKIAGALKDLF